MSCSHHTLNRNLLARSTQRVPTWNTKRQSVSAVITEIQTEANLLWLINIHLCNSIFLSLEHMSYTETDEKLASTAFHTQLWTKMMWVCSDDICMAKLERKMQTCHLSSTGEKLEGTVTIIFFFCISICIFSLQQILTENMLMWSGNGQFFLPNCG